MMLSSNYEHKKQYHDNFTDELILKLQKNQQNELPTTDSERFAMIHTQPIHNKLHNGQVLINDGTFP